tara:strand:- start:4070 stop:4291 length:222 start_codon:yes stop_codon:yes gene_type:complete
MTAIAIVALEVAKLGISALEAANAGNLFEARAHLSRARSRVEDADKAWEAAAQQGDTEIDRVDDMPLEDTTGL